ncbi:hypothetical protein [Serratia ureilytica]|uniref:hypothetical protein n=1 Tax=Serratia ureilytica TaxID=300181 RepID=UPI001D17D601|nr:hypothetical protein [Serratia ureilytica]MCC4109097.1 hypothetical protein [Serratia ureilytica]
MKRGVIIVLALLLSVVYASYLYFFGSREIHQIYQNVEYWPVSKQNCKSTVVLVNNASISNYGKKKLWLDNENLLMGKWKSLESECDSIHFIKNKTERATFPGENNYWVDDYQYCLNGALGSDKCISKYEILFAVQLEALTLKDKIISEYKGKQIYLHSIDN